MLEVLFTYILPGSVILGLVPAIVATRKGQSFLAWWAFGTLLFVIALPLSILLRKESPLKAGKQCDYCKESVAAESEFCPACHFHFYDPVQDGPAIPASHSPVSEQVQAKSYSDYRGIHPVLAR